MRIKTKKTFFIPIAIFLCLIIALALGLKNGKTELPSPFIGKAAPKFVLPELYSDNQSVSEKDFLNKVSLLNIWASWCESCQHEHPFLNQLRNNTSIQFVGLNYKDNSVDAKKWLAQLGNPYHLVATDIKGNVGIDYGVYGVPETFIIDKQGIIQFKHVGELTDDVINKDILPLVQQLTATK